MMSVGEWELTRAMLLMRRDLERQIQGFVSEKSARVKEQIWLEPQMKTTTPDDAFIVVGHDHKGALAPSPHPVAHTIEARAVAEAERLAAANPGQRFAVFACIGVAVVEKPAAFRKTQFRINAEIPF
jgi:hypothetical protein